MAPAEVRVRLPGADATGRLAAALAATAPVPAVVHLSGDLGAGKSTLARAWLRALGVTGAIRSPTYTLVERYALAGRYAPGDDAEALHLDLYRIGDAGELEFLGLDGVEAALWLVEWPERGGASLPAADLRVSLAIAGQGRDAVLEAGGEVGAAWLARLVQEPQLRDLPVPG